MSTTLHPRSPCTYGAVRTVPDYPESHFGGSQRATVLAAASGLGVALATGNSTAGLNGWYMSMLMHKEAWSRLGFFGTTCRPVRFRKHALRPWRRRLYRRTRGPNYPNYAMNVGHQGGYAGIAGAAHYARGDAWALSP
jgi:methyl-coenzyme M reductase alpha subunit